MTLKKFFELADALKENDLKVLSDDGKLIVDMSNSVQYKIWENACAVLAAYLFLTATPTTKPYANGDFWALIKAHMDANDLDFENWEQKATVLATILADLSYPENIDSIIAQVREVRKLEITNGEVIASDFKLQATNVDQYMKTNPENSNLQAVVLYVAPTGNDAATGVDWDNPLKTLTEVFKRLPNNLDGRVVYIYAKGGVVNTNFSFFKSNGVIHVYHCSPWMNASTHPVAVQARAGKTNPFTSEEPIVFTNSTESATVFKAEGDATLLLQSANLDLPYNTAGHLQGDKFLIKADHAASQVVGLEVYGGVSVFAYGGGISIKADNMTHLAFFSSTGTSLDTQGIRIYADAPYNGNPIDLNNSRVFLKSWGHKYLSGANWKIENIKSAFFRIQGGGVNSTIDLNSGNGFEFTAGTTGETKAKVSYTSIGTAELVYDSTKITLTDGSLQAHIVNGQLKSPLGAYVNSRPIYKASATAPVDADLQPGDIAFYRDDVANTLKIKGKEADGTVFNATISYV